MYIILHNIGYLFLTHEKEENRKFEKLNNINTLLHKLKFKNQ